MQVSESGNCSKQVLEAVHGSSLAGAGSVRAPQQRLSKLQPVLFQLCGPGTTKYQPAQWRVRVAAPALSTPGFLSSVQEGSGHASCLKGDECGRLY